MRKLRILGRKIRIINMRGEPNYAGREGVIEHIDALGQLHGTWGGLAILPDQDIYEFIGDDDDKNETV